MDDKELAQDIKETIKSLNTLLSEAEKRDIIVSFSFVPTVSAKQNNKLRVDSIKKNLL